MAFALVVMQRDFAFITSTLLRRRPALHRSVLD